MSSISIKKLRRFEDSLILCMRNISDSFLDPIITCEEKWILYYNRTRSDQGLDHEESPKHLPKQKFIVIVWWSAINFIHYNFLETS